MTDTENSFFGLKVPDGTDRRELYKSQYRGIWTYKMSASELDEAFRTAVTGDGPDGGWSIKNDERVKYVGKLEVSKGEDTTLKVRAPQTQTRDRCLGEVGEGEDSKKRGGKGAGAEGRDGMQLEEIREAWAVPDPARPRRPPVRRARTQADANAPFTSR